MPRVPLHQVAHARSGDKGDASNVGLVANSPALFEVIRREVTPERVKAHFAGVCRGEVERHVRHLAYRRRGAPPAGDDACALRDKQPRGLQPDPPGRAGHETPLAAESEVHERG